jgi:hypothetical protein
MSFSCFKTTFKSKTILVNEEIRYECHFYAQPESGKRIKFYYGGAKALMALHEIINLSEFNLISIQGSFSVQRPHKYNIYHHCKVLERGIGSTPGQLYVLFDCTHIESSLTEPEITQMIRKEKLLQIGIDD